MSGGGTNIRRILELDVFYGCMHWPGQLEHGQWIPITAPRIMAFIRTEDGSIDPLTFVATDFVARRADGIAAQVYAEEGTPEAVLAEHWHRAV